MKIPDAYATAVKKKAIDLTISTNPIGCPPRVLNAVRAMTGTDISNYPDQTELIRLLSKKFRIREDSILLGTGSEQLIKIAAQAFLAAGDTVAVESGSFYLFTAEPLLINATVSYFSLPIKKAIPNTPEMLYMANPTTPGGENRSADALLGSIDRINPAMAIVDEANGEFCDSSLVPETKIRKNLIVLRTFSKALGLAGLRVGFAIGNPLRIAKMKRYQQCFAVSGVALKAASAIIDDTEFIERTKRFVKSERLFLSTALKSRGFGVSDSVTNNIYVSRPDSKMIIRMLARENVGVIEGSYFPGNRTPGFRISIKDRKTNRAFLTRLDKALSCLPKRKLLRSKEVI